VREATVTEAVTLRVHRFHRWMPQLVAAAAEIGGTDPAILVGPGRAPWAVTLRDAIVVAAVDVFEKNWSAIARDLGGRNHAAIICSYNRGKLRLGTDGEFRQLLPLILAIARAIKGAEPAVVDVEPQFAL